MILIINLNFSKIYLTLESKKLIIIKNHLKYYYYYSLN